MAYLSKEQVIERKFITDATLATQLMAGELTLDDDIIKEHITALGAYLLVYGDNNNTPADTSDDKTIDDPATPNRDESTQEGAAAAATEAAAADAAVDAEQTESDEDESNDITFTVDGTEVSYDGALDVAAKTVLRAKSISGTLYTAHDVVFDPKGLKAADLRDLVLFTTNPEEVAEVAEPAGE